MKNFQMSGINGWFMDIYPQPAADFIVWILGEDGQRHKFKLAMPGAFYATGSENRLREAANFLKQQPEKITLSRQDKRDLFKKKPVSMLAVESKDAGQLTGLFRRLSQAYPALDYYNADIPPALQCAARFGTFPLCRCRVDVNQSDYIDWIEALDTPWQVNLPEPPVRVLYLEPDCDPRRGDPQYLWVRFDQRTLRLFLSNLRPTLISLRSILNAFDPDLILTAWGDSWMMPLLLEASEKHRIPLPWNRDPGRSIEYKKERSYFAYNQVVYRDQQIHLFGRWHIDINNATLYHDYAMDGIYELARVTSLPLQTVARVSPGSGISAMQITTALRNDILVPWHKQQAEKFKTARQLMEVDQGGLVYQPTIGLHRNVAELDFISMYPSIMVHCNISPETTPVFCGAGTSIGAEKEEPGLIPKTLAPLLEKRLAIKKRLEKLSRQDSRRQALKARASAHKWLLVTCFGYLGYKNARFGRIEAHESVTAFGREALLRAKEAAEELGYTVLHLYVDGIWVKHPEPITVENVQPLLEEITRCSGLPIALDGIYNWLAFSPSRLNSRVPVANRYFGVFEDGTIKVRGIEARRRDAPPWIAGVQHHLLDLYASTKTEEDIQEASHQAVSYLQGQLTQLRTGSIPAAELIVSCKLSRTLDQYVSPSPAAQAAAQLQNIGKTMRPGQVMRYIYLSGQPRIHAWDLPEPPDLNRIDHDEYSKLLLRAAATITLPFGMDEEALKRAVLQNLPQKTQVKKAATLFPLYRYQT